jgi:small ligand-binding sensory domain FIST
MVEQFSAVAHWDEPWDEDVFSAWARGFRSRVPVAGAVLGVVFMASKWFDRAETTLELLRVHAAIPVLIGCSGSGLIANGEEIEVDAGIVVGIYVLPDAVLKTVRITQSHLESGGDLSDWMRITGIHTIEANGWLGFADPFTFDAERWLKDWSEVWPRAPVLGGLASAGNGERSMRLFLDGEVFEDGAVAVAICGEVGICSLVSQGCTPIGDTWTITGAEKNLIQSIGNRPAYEILLETYQGLTSDDQERARGNMFVGLVINEYLEDFQRGDFLVRNILGGDPKSGTIAVGAFPRTGQTLQFQKRDSAAATEDMADLLVRTKELLADTSIYGACLFSCCGRGAGLFGRPNHDAWRVRETFGSVGVAGFFCNGEIGPIGARNFIHGYTASLAIFVQQASLLPASPA